MKRYLISFILSAVVFLLICHSPASGQGHPAKDTFLVDLSKPVLRPPRQNPETRTQIKKDPVAEYREKTLHGEFVVRLYQTSKTLHYRVDVNLDGLPGSDTVRLPDLGIDPHPMLQKGETPKSCLVGFIDNDNHFREIKLVYVAPKGNQFTITTLRHWHVSTHYRLVSQ